MKKQSVYKTLTYENRVAVEESVKSLLHASRDCLRNLKKNTQILTYSVIDGYYAEAFGIMRGLAILGYGYIGSVNLDGSKDSGLFMRNYRIPEGMIKSDIERLNVNWWFHKLCDEVLVEEGYEGDNVCEYCMKNWGKDSRICDTWT